MAIMDFKQIDAIYPGEAERIDPFHNNPALAAVDGHDPRTTLYDPLWGYFLFDQQVGFQYNDTDTYQDKALFTIQGVFTAGAEIAYEESEAFTALVARYEALEAAFAAAGQAEDPSDYSQWGTADDPRAIALPAPLRDADGEVLYALPQALEIEQTRFPVLIRYRAVLLEAKFPATKLKINDTILDAGVVSIQPPTPMLREHTMVGAKGAVIQVKNFSVLEVDVSGTLPHRPSAGQVFTDRTREFIDGLGDGEMDVKVLYRQGKEDPVETVVWEDMLVSQPDLQVHYEEQVIEVSVNGRE